MSKSIKRSVFLDDLGAVKMDLRGRPKCHFCGIRLTLKNWGGSVSQLGDSRKDVVHHCDKENCIDKAVKDAL